MITRQVIREIELPDHHFLAEAEGAIADFETSIAPGVWPCIDKSTLATQMRDRIRNPYRINQGGQPFCGPAAVLFELVRKQPKRYVEMCRNLYQLGGFYGASQFITSSKQLQCASTGDLRMEAVDWMLLATFREMENILFPVEPNAPDVIRDLAGMTKSWEMKGWVKEILGYTQVNYDHAFLTNDIQSLNKAASILQKGGVAFALITADGLLNDKPPLVPFPSHWVALLGNISVQANIVNVDIYTWSKKLRLQVDQSSFKKYFWATVTGLA